METQFRLNELDALGFQALRKACIMTPLDDDMLNTALDGSLFTLSAICGDKLSGMLRVVGDGAFVFLIYDVLVLPECRRRGLGGRLIDHALRVIETMLPAGLWVTVNLFSAPGKEDFYRRRGFYALPNENFGSGMQIIVKSVGAKG